MGDYWKRVDTLDCGSGPGRTITNTYEHEVPGGMLVRTLTAQVYYGYVTEAVVHVAINPASGAPFR